MEVWLHNNDFDVATPLIFDAALGAADVVRGSGNIFRNGVINNSGTNRRGHLEPPDAINPSTVTSGSTTTLDWNYRTHRVGGSATIATIHYGGAAAKNVLFGGVCRLIADDGATPSSWSMSAAGNIVPLTTATRTPGTVVTLVWDAAAGKWYETAGGGGSGTNEIGDWTDLGNLGSTETITGAANSLVRRKGTLDNDTAITLTMSDNQQIELLLVQDATGNRAPTWVTSTTWLTRSGVAPNLKFMGASQVAHFEFKKIAGTLYGKWLNEPQAGRELDYRERTSDYTVTATSVGSGGIISELVTPQIIGRGYPVLVEAEFPLPKDSTSADQYIAGWIEWNLNGGSFSQIQLAVVSSPTTATGRTLKFSIRKTLTAGSTYVFQVGAYKQGSGDTVVIGAASDRPIMMAVTER
jgi:hypothetical protein